MEKDFDNWNNLKQKLDNKSKTAAFKQKEVWWCHLGSNIGDEENGKGEVHSRPILIVKKFNKNLFWGIPLTTQIKENPYYHKIIFKNKEQCAMISQLRLWDAKRLSSQMGEITQKHMSEIQQKIIDVTLNKEGHYSAPPFGEASDGYCQFVNTLKH